MNNIKSNQIDFMRYVIKSRYDRETSKTNSLSTDTYNTLVQVAEKVNGVKDKVSVLADMLTDLKVLNGSANNLINLSEMSIIDNKNIKIEDGVFTLDSLLDRPKEINISTSGVSSTSSFFITDQRNKQSTLEDLLRSDEPTTFTFPTTPYNMVLTLRYNRVEQINALEVGLSLLTESYPEIKSIKYVDNLNEIKDVIILDNNLKTYSLDENRKRDNLYSLSITPVLTNQLIVEFGSSDAESVTFNKIKTYFKNIAQEGSIILGPIHTEQPVLKLAIDSQDITKGVSLEVSTDKESWISLTNSSSMITENGSRKILSINTIAENSIKNNDDVYTLFFKITLKSTTITNDDLVSIIYNTFREEGIISNEALSTVEDNKISAYRVKNSDFVYGKYKFTQNLNLAKLDMTNIEYIENNGATKVLGLVENKFSVTTSSNQSTLVGSIGAELRLKRVPARKIIDGSRLDISSAELYEINLRDSNETVNINNKDNLCLYLDNAEDQYSIISKESRKSLTLDFNTPFVKNNSAVLIAVPHEDIEVRNSLGELIKQVPKEELLTLEENGESFYFISLVGIIFKAPEVTYINNLGQEIPQVFSPLFPLRSLDNNEFGFYRGKINSITSPLLKVNGKEIIKENIKHSKVVNRINTNYIKREDDEFSYYVSFTVVDNRGKSVFKILSSCIEQGTMKLYNNTGNSLFKEVAFVDGTREFYKADYVTKILEKGANVFELESLAEEDSLRFSGDVSLFKKRVYSTQDLEIAGSWYYDKEGNKIYIHTNLATSLYTNTVVTYQGKLRNKEEGLYSVDYDKGVLYTSTPVKYIHMEYKRAIQYVEGQAMEQVDGRSYDNSALYNIPTDQDEKITYIYQLRNTPETIRSKESLDNGRVSLVTLGDKDE